MAPKSKKGKIFMQEKDKLLQLAETISSGKERRTRDKVDRTKATGASHDDSSKQKDSQRRKSGSIAASDKLRTAKEQLAAHRNRHKREKLKARKRQVQASKGDVQISRESDEYSSLGGVPNRKRVSFA